MRPWFITPAQDEMSALFQHCVSHSKRYMEVKLCTDRLIGRMERSDLFCTAGETGHHIPSLGRQTALTRTIRRCLLDIGLRARHPALTSRHRSQRLSWCKARRQWSLEWRSILFSDESRFGLGRNNSQRLVWRPHGQCHEEAFTREQILHLGLVCN